MLKNTKPIYLKKSHTEPKKKSVDFFIVGMGGSAGGLSAFIEILENIPADTNLAFVIVQHLLADTKSSLSEILDGKTKLPVKEVTKDTLVRPGQVYVIPPNKNISLKDEKLILSPRPHDGLNLPIDKFFISLAKGRKQNAIAVILSGTGSDGTLGMKAIREAGGITFAQDKSATFPAMPENVVKAGLADYILNPAKIAKKLLQIVANPPYYSAKIDSSLTFPMTDKEDKKYQIILKLILDSTEVDFTYYKTGTLKRRIKRRMDLKNFKNIGEYAEFLEKNPEEVKTLYQDLLIKVTNFFRDQSMFDYLKTSVFPKIFKGQPQSFRIWTPGCSTGEEVYSLAISLAEYMEKTKKHIPVQIFGTDISEEALNTARRARYPISIETSIPTKILDKYFLKDNDGYTVNPNIRAMCIFARHNMIKDVPFTKMDIVSCRNVLIYLDSVLQKRAFPIFHYALKPNGFLVLGTAETVSSFSDLFLTVDKDQKIYAKKAGVSTPRLSFSAPNPPLLHTIKIPELELTNIEEQADKIVLQKHSSPGVIINDDLSIIQFRGDVSPYLKHSSGRASLDLIKMTHKTLLAKLLDMINEARKKSATVTKIHSGLKINIEVIPLFNKLSAEKHFLILFTEAHLLENTTNNELIEPAMMQEVEEELSATVTQLQSLLETRDTVNEELRSANEEVMSANEELQSTNEELETTKEELQSTNEELLTLNTELWHRNLDLQKIEVSHDLMVPEFELRGDELNRKDEFISILGHELRNPLAPIMHSVELAKIQRIKDPETKKLMAVIEHHAKQMKYIIDNLLDTARAQKGKITLLLEIANFDKLADQALETMRVFVDTRQHDMKIHHPKAPVFLSIDPVRVTQIITNLINNAAKYTPNGGKIIIRISTEGDIAKLSVRDNGIGISKEMLPKIFDIFSQVIQPLDNNKGGLGVGLMLARSLAELHGGTLTATSPGLGLGSEFVLHLPLLKETDVMKVRTSEPEPEEEKIRQWKILVVDDNIALADLMGKLLRVLDQDVVVAYDGASAIDLVKKKKPDLIFVDISMPSMDGYALVKILRKNPELKKTKIMALSGFGDEYKERSIKAGFDVHLTKPLTMSELKKILVELDAD